MEEVRVLGTLEVRNGDAALPLGTPKERAFLALLVANVNRVVSLDRLADELWHGEPPEKVTDALRVYASRLRKLLREGSLLRKDPGYVLSLPTEALDVGRFATLVDEGRASLQAGDAPRAAATLRQALDLWRGAPFEDVDDLDSLAAEATRLEEARLAALEDRIDADLQCGQHRELVGELTALVAEQPLRERLWSQLMVALYRSGRQADALRAYQRARIVLVEELGIEPGSALRNLEAAMLAQDPSLDHVVTLAPVQLPAHSPVPGNLPLQVNSFVGRHRELETVKALVAERALITLTGVGGVGKTRLALQVAAEVAPDFPDGTWLCELAPVTDPAAVWETLAECLGVRPMLNRSIKEVTLGYLAQKRLVLVIDNCEHLLEPVATLVAAICQRCGKVASIATSREGLAIPGEQIIAVPRLGVPSADDDRGTLMRTDAVQLFCDRACEAKREFTANEHNATAIGQLCRRLDGIPLAIELAASRIQVMTPKEMLDHLDRRFKLLSAGRRSAVSRHQTLRNTLDWSYDLLDEPERVVLRRLSVFTGDFDLAAAGAVVAGERLDALEVTDFVFKLVEKSLVVAQPGTDVTRYRLLETVRDYAWERLLISGEADEIARRHCDHYRCLAEQLGPRLCGRDELASRDQIERELDNLRAALRWAVDSGDVESALRLVDALAIVGSLRSPFGSLPREAAYMQEAQGNPLGAVALASAAAALSFQGDNQQAAGLAEDAVQAAYEARGSPLGGHAMCRVFTNVAMVTHIQNDSARLLKIGNDWLGAARELDSAFEISQASDILGSLLLHQDEALEACELALTLARQLGSPSRIAYSSIIFGMRLGMEDTDRAEAAFAEALGAAREAKNDWIDSFAAQQLGILQARRGDLAGSAGTLLDEAGRSNRKGDHVATSLTIRFLALVFASMGEAEMALLLGAWAEHNGVANDATHPLLVDIGAAYEALRSDESVSEQSRPMHRAAELEAGEIISQARSCLDQVAGKGPKPGDLTRRQ